MGFWSWLKGDHAGITANTNPTEDPPTVGAGDYTPGDPDGIELEGEETFSRGFPTVSSSPWDGWPSEWDTPNWQTGIKKLVDTAWNAIDLNSSVLAAMPNYRLQSGRIVDHLPWQLNPDPDIYTSWYEFAKQLFWDYHLGEVFVIPTGFFATGRPATFRVVPPWSVKVEMDGPIRIYHIGGLDVTDGILHIRYKSTVDNAHGIGPLESAGARVVASGVLTRYMTDLAQTGGTTKEWIETEKQLTRAQSDNLRDQHALARQRNPNAPAVMSGGAKLSQSDGMSAKDMALLELAQFTEARIATHLGVPPFLLGLPSGDSMTYSNVNALFDFHDRSSLRPKATSVMSAVSGWALPRGQAVELNRDEYSRPALNDRAEAYVKLAGIVDADGRPAISVDEIRQMERLVGPPGRVEVQTTAASQLTGDDS